MANKSTGYKTNYEYSNAYGEFYCTKCEKEGNLPANYCMHCGKELEQHQKQGLKN